TAPTATDAAAVTRSPRRDSRRPATNAPHETAFEPCRHYAGMDRPAPLTVREAAAALCCAQDAGRGLIREGELRTGACGVRPGRIPRQIRDAYLRRHRARSSTTP